MFKAKKTIIILLSIFSILTVGSFVLAQDNLGMNYAGDLNLPASSESDLRNLLVNIIRYFLGFLGIIAVAVILYAGFLWMTSSGRPDQLAKAKKTLLNGVVGLIIIISAFAIVTFIINLFEGGTGTGSRSGRPDESLGGIGALGACAVESVYPSPGQDDVPRNTSIIVTFKKDIDPATVIGAGMIVEENIHIYMSSQGDSCEWVTDHYENCDVSNLTDVNVSQSGRTFVFTPNVLLGNPTSNTNYSVRLDQAISDLDGNSIFADCRTDNMIWSFSVSNRLDLVPPQVENNGVSPVPDDDQDTSVPTAATAAVGAITVLEQPQFSQSADAAMSLSSPNPGTVVVNSGNTESGTVWVTVLSDDVTAQLSRDGGAPLLGSALFDGQDVTFSGYFTLTATNPVAAGQTFYIDLTGRQNADTLTVGPITYTFVGSGAGVGEINLGTDINATAANIASELNSANPAVNASASGSTIGLTAASAGASGNSIDLRTNNSSKFTFVPMSGGTDAYTSLTTVGMQDPARNIIVQIDFNEAINPATISGDIVDVADAIRVRCVGGACAEGLVSCGGFSDCVAGHFEISNQYRTAEFIPEAECGVNSCGEAVYCLPGNSRIEVWLHAASLEPCSNDSDCLSRETYNTCNNAPGNGNHCNNGSAYYPLSSLAAMDGIMDTANNSLDGNRDNYAYGPSSSDYDENSDSGTGDNYVWSFWVSEDVDTTPPAISFIYPDISDSNVDLSLPLEVQFTKPMQSSSLKTGQSKSVIDGETITHRHINLWNYANRSTGYWITNEDARDANGFPLYTTAYINHSILGPLLTYRTQVGSGVRDIYQNCFRPAEGPGCAATPNSCCNGVNEVGETCP